MAIYRGTGAAADGSTIPELVVQAETAATSAGASATSAANSAASALAIFVDTATMNTAVATTTTNATNASNSATSAATQSAIATAAADAANASATASAASASSSASSATNAAASYDAFDDRYLGSKATAPTLDNDGMALLTGALYWNTATTQLYVWTGSGWNSAAFGPIAASETAAGDGSTTVFSVPFVPNLIHINGVYQNKNTYTVSGGNATFSNAPPAASVIEFCVVANSTPALNYKGTWNASANTPALASGVGTTGDYYRVSVAGSTTLDGISTWGVGDIVSFYGTVWQRTEGVAGINVIDLVVSGTTTLSGLTASTALALDASKNVVSVTNTGTGDNVLAIAPTLVGNVTLSTGNLVIGTAGKGIDFSAASHASGMTSELLDDYEEGTWTPTPSGITVNSGTPVYSGNYTKVGRLVTLNWYMSGGNITTVAGTSKFTNMPFANNAGYSHGVFMNELTYANGIMESGPSTNLVLGAAITGAYLGGTITYMAAT